VRVNHGGAGRCSPAFDAALFESGWRKVGL